MKSYKIDDAALQTGLTKRTIRYYEELGLIDSPERTEGGMRLYTEADIERLKKIVLAKEVLGFSLQELQHFIKMNEIIDQQRSVVRSLEDRIERKRKLQEISEGLQKEIDMIDVKINRMNSFKQELLTLDQRVQEAMTKIAD